ncbi:MAG TPA: DUF4184 family protein [Steroidobacteraceae bacterium]|nr:DUF4184 family protein [Steroidobacteraceae bacterium]
MPFTFAHPAAVLPLRRLKPLQTVPLIVGSIVPDLPYYIPARLGRTMLETHTVAGSFWLDIPLGLLTLLLCFLLRKPLGAPMSPRARALYLQAMERFREQPRHWLLAPISLLVGTWTHLLWDSFTHDNGWVVRRVAALSAPITIGAYTSTVCHFLQYASSVAGLLILAIWYLRLPAPSAASGPALAPAGARIAILLLVCVAAAAIGGYIAMHAAMMGARVYRVIYLLLTRSIGWFAVLYLAAGLLLVSRKPEPVPEV